jgi:hypothetical protein
MRSQQIIRIAILAQLRHYTYMIDTANETTYTPCMNLHRIIVTGDPDRDMTQRCGFA